MSIRTKMLIDGRTRDLALFSLAVDCKLRGCDLVALGVDDNVSKTRLRHDAPHGRTVDRATVKQQRTGRPVRFEITDQTREAVDAYSSRFGCSAGQCPFPGRRRPGEHLTTRQYAQLVGEWVASNGLDSRAFGTHSMRLTKATLICRRTSNLPVVQLLFGHTKIESTGRYLGIEVDDALEIARKTDRDRRGRGHGALPAPQRLNHSP